MYIINIFIASIVALGFWKRTSKEVDLKTAKATFSKTFIFFLLAMALTYFYYKTYQVATFKYLICVDPYKGSFDKKRVYNEWSKDTLDEIIPNDRISKLTIFNSFSNKKTDILDSQRDLYETKKVGGIRVEMKLDNTKDSNILLSTPGFIPSDFEELRCCYDISLMTNSVPSLFPFSAYEESLNTGFFTTEKDSMNFISYSKNISRENDVFGVDYDKLYCVRLSTKERKKSIEQSASSKRFNSLNFFSAADLSQSQFMFIIISDIPIEKLLVYFDIPIEVTSGNIIQDESDSRFFSVDFKNQNNSAVNPFAFYHIKFPTLSNLQLIRSLILTTLLTILYSLFFNNLYYYGRKLYERRKREQKKSFTYSRKMVLLWVPVGKIIVWTFIVAFAFLLILSILDYNFRINEESVPLLIFIIGISLLLYMILLCGTFYFLYRKGIYIKDLKENLLCKFKKREKGKDDDKPSSKKDEQPAGTIKIEDKPVEATKIECQAEKTTKVEDSKIIENTELKDGQKSSRKPSQPKKGKTRKRKR